MHIITIAELVFRGSRQSKNSAKASHYQLKQLDTEDNEAETLLYDNEWDVENKRFYMYGDADISRKNSPYRDVQQKVCKIVYNLINNFLNFRLNKLKLFTAAFFKLPMISLTELKLMLLFNFNMSLKFCACAALKN